MDNIQCLNFQTSCCFSPKFIYSKEYLNVLTLILFKLLNISYGLDLACQPVPKTESEHLEYAVHPKSAIFLYWVLRFKKLSDKFNLRCYLGRDWYFPHFSYDTE
jgi:hypothetical protein